MRRIPTEELERICRGVDGDCGLYVYAPGAEEETFSIQADLPFIAASTIKIPILAVLLQAAEQGKVDLERPLRLRPENRVGGSGILQSLRPEMELSLFDLAVLMMVLSDNSATNEVIDAVGMDEVNRFCRENGYLHTVLGRKLQMKSSVGTPSQNFTSAGDLGRMLCAAAQSTLVTPEVSRTLLRIMAGQRLQKFAAVLPAAEHFDPRAELQPPAEGKVLLASKGGTLTAPGISHDAAVFFLPDGRYYVMVMLTRTSNVKKALVPLGQAASAMYEAMK